MAFVKAAALSFLLLVLCVFIHYEAFRFMSGRFGLSRDKDRRFVLLVVAVAMLAHIAEMIVFAVGYYMADDLLRLGTFVGAASPGAADYLYFSMETYTSLGVGDVHPVGATRVMVGLETLGGLMLIGWTTSFTYLSMRRFWNGASD
jgi:hypothetical protein